MRIIIVMLGRYKNDIGASVKLGGGEVDIVGLHLTSGGQLVAQVLTGDPFLFLQVS